MRRTLLTAITGAGLLGIYASMPAYGAAPATAQGIITYRTHPGDARTAIHAGTAVPDGTYYPKRMEGPYNGINVDNGDDPGDDDTRPPGDLRNNYTMELVGYFYPPKTGKIQFAMASDDPGELWFSTDDNAANKVKIANEPQWQTIRAFAAEGRRTMVESGDAPVPRTENQSKYIDVTQGKPYFIQAIGVEYGGGDNTAVGFRYDSDAPFADGDLPIKGMYLSTIDRGDLGKTYLSKFAASATGFAADIHDGDGAAAASLAAASVKVELDGATVTATTSKAGVVSTITYTKTDGFLASGSTHTAKITYNDSKGVSATVEKSFTVAKYALLTSDLRVTPDTAKRGFLWRVHQNTEAGTGNNNTRTENQLSGAIKDANGASIANLADPSAVGGADGAAAAPNPASAPITFEVSKVINFDQAGGSNGAFSPDEQMPGIPGVDGSTDAIAAEIITYIDLPVGLVRMGVNSDDGFKTTVGPTGDVLSPPTLAGEFNGGRGAADTLFTMVVQTAGVYPFRTTWEEGGGGANIEWFSIKTDGTKVLINDDANGGYKSYRAVQATAKKAIVRKALPAPGSGGTALDPQITVEIVDGSTPVASSTVSLMLDGAAVSATVTKAADVTTASFKQTTPFSLKSKHTVTLTYTDAGNVVVRTWNFTTLNHDLIAYWDFNSASDPAKTLDKVGGYAGVFQSGAKISADAKGRTGRPGDRAATIGTATPAVNGWIRVGEPDVTFMNAGGIQNQLAISLWQKLEETRNSSAFWANGVGQDRAFQAHIPWSDMTIYFDTGGGCCDGTQRINKNIADFPGATPDTFFLQWHHFVFQKNGDNKQVWIDGKLFHEGVNNSPLPFEFTILSIGSDSGGGNNTHGDLDDFAIWASALTEAEIIKLSTGTSPSDIRPVTAAPVITRIARNANGTLTVEWTGGGTLQAGAAVTGPWQDVTGATSPYTFTPTGAALFGRIKK